MAPTEALHNRRQVAAPGPRCGRDPLRDVHGRVWLGPIQGRKSCQSVHHLDERRDGIHTRALDLLAWRPEIVDDLRRELLENLDGRR